jgi:hypothetical protein
VVYVRIDDQFFGDARLIAAERALLSAGWSLEESRFAVIGALVSLWHYCQDKKKSNVDSKTIAIILGSEAIKDALTFAGFIVLENEGYEVVGSRKRLEEIETYRMQQSAAGKASAAQRSFNGRSTGVNGRSTGVNGRSTVVNLPDPDPDPDPDPKKKIQIQDFDLRSTADTIENAETLPLRGPNPAPSAFDSVPVSEEVGIVDSSAGKVSTLTQLPKLTPTRQKRQKNDAETPPGALVWEAYAAAYEERYRVAPIRNARQNAIAARIAKSMGLEDAILCARHFLVINDQFFLKCGHAFKLLESNWESILLQAKKGVRYTQAAAKIADRDSHNDDVGRRVIEQFRLREEKARTNEPIEEGKTQYGKI